MPLALLRGRPLSVVQWSAVTWACAKDGRKTNHTQACRKCAMAKSCRNPSITAAGELPLLNCEPEPAFGTLYVIKGEQGAIFHHPNGKFLGPKPRIQYPR